MSMTPSQVVNIKYEAVTLHGGCVLSFLFMGFLHSSHVLRENPGLVCYNEVLHSLTLMQ